MTASTDDDAGTPADTAARSPMGKGSERPGRIFLSYRRDDSAGYAGRIFDRLTERFGRKRVFMDVSTIGVGHDFVQAIEKEVGGCAALVVVMGRRWVEIADESGRRRIDDPRDYVRLEVAKGLLRGPVVIPVLVDGARMPTPELLPDELSGLARRNAIELSNTRWDYDVGQLLDAIEAQGVPPAKQPAPRRWLVAAAAAAALVVAGVVAWHFGRSDAAKRTGVAGDRAAAGVVVRSAVAVAGLEASSAGEESRWLATAIEEMVESQLGAGGQLRTVDGAAVADRRRGLGLPIAGPLPAEGLARLGRALGTDYLVDGRFGLLSSGELALLKVELDLRRASDGASVAKGQATGTATQLFDVVARALEPLRGAAGAQQLTAAQKLEVRAALPEDPKAARLYAEGIEALRRLDAPKAKELLERAVAAAPDHPLPHAGLARAWDRLGYKAHAVKEAARAVELAGTLAEPAQMLLRGQHAELAEDWPAAARVYQDLLKAFPDDLRLALELANVLISVGRSEEAKVVVEGLATTSPEARDAPEVELTLARAEFRLGDWKELLRHARAAAEKASGHGDRLAEARAERWVGYAQRELGDLDAARQALEKARELFSGHGDPQGLAEALEVSAFVLAQQGDTSGALNLASSALATYEQTGDRLSAARVKGNLAKMLRERGEVERSRKLFDEALAVATEIGARYQAAQLLQEQAVVEHVAGNLELATGLYQRSLATFTEIGNKSGMADVFTNLAELALVQGRLAEARDLNEQSLAMYREAGDRSWVAYAQYRSGLIARVRGDRAAARRIFEEALQTQEELKEATAAAQTRTALAQLTLREGDAARAGVLAKEAAEALRSDALGDPLVLALVVRGEAELAVGDLSAAKSTAKEVGELAGRSGDEEVLSRSAVFAAQVARRAGDSRGLETARRALEAQAAAARKAGRMLPELELRLELARIRQLQGDRSTLAKVASEAEAMGALDLAARARED